MGSKLGDVWKEKGTQIPSRWGVNGIGIKLIPPLKGVGATWAWGIGHGAWGALPMPYAHACQTVVLDSSQTDQRWDSSPFSLIRKMIGCTTAPMNGKSMYRIPSRALA